MSWMGKLYTTYQNNLVHVGEQSDSTPLLPASHTTQKTQVNIVLDGDGNFIRASVVPQKDARTIIPATENSAGRTSGPSPHPLCDKLQYVAGDYVTFGGKKKYVEVSGKKKLAHEAYKELLRGWVEAEKTQLKLRAVFSYVCKGHVIADLVASRVLHVNSIDSEGVPNTPQLLTKWAGNGEKPEIFKLLPNDQTDAFVRWSVELPGDPQAAVWTDRSLWESWSKYYASIRTKKGFCYATGNSDALLAEQHPRKVRHDGDGAKLISANDTAGYTFRGRFISADEACGVDFEVTHKAHSALRWLIQRQGSHSGNNQAVVAWAVSGAEIPDPLADTAALFADEHTTKPVSSQGYTAQEIGIQLTKLVDGYSVNLDPTDDVVVMCLDSATTGRISINFYRELKGSEFLERIKSWHLECCWHQKFGKNKEFRGAPAPWNIAEAAYGKRLDDNLRKATVERLLPCIVDGVPAPRDLVESCVRRASNRQSFDETWEWEKVLGIACALYNCHHKERGYSMALERERKTRDYLFGRLLALAEHLESRALHVAGEKRETNAARLMQRFADRPCSTWRTLEISLTPYKIRLRAKRPGFLHTVEKEIDEVINAFGADDYLTDTPLTGEFLLGYHCQRAFMQTPADNGQAGSEVEPDEQTE